MSKTQKIRYGLIIGAIIMIAENASSMSYSDLSWAPNKGSYSGIISMFLLILSMVYTIRHVNKNPEK